MILYDFAKKSSMYYMLLSPRRKWGLSINVVHNFAGKVDIYGGQLDD